MAKVKLSKFAKGVCTECGGRLKLSDKTNVQYGVEYHNRCVVCEDCGHVVISDKSERQKEEEKEGW
jgi:uncharacterized protein with PIN domain